MDCDASYDRPQGRTLSTGSTRLTLKSHAIRTEGDLIKISPSKSDPFESRIDRLHAGGECVLLPEKQWEACIEDGSVLLSAWSNGRDRSVRYWVKFDPSNPAKDHACLDDLEGVFISKVNLTAG
jgi:hypothetical protein